MKEFDNVDDILNFAIEKEEEAALLYRDLASRTENPGTKRLFEELTEEELRHKAKLLAIKSSKLLAPLAEKVTDLKISDYLTELELGPDLDYQQALSFAMQAEKAELELYTDLAQRVESQTLRNTLLMLAQEEAKHKLKLEIEYDEHVLAEN